jgi:hypothetical protein
MQNCSTETRREENIWKDWIDGEGEIVCKWILGNRMGGFRCGESSNCDLLGFDAMPCGRLLPNFLRYMLLPSSRLKSLLFKMLS